MCLVRKLDVIEDTLLAPVLAEAAKKSVRALRGMFFERNIRGERPQRTGRARTRSPVGITCRSGEGVGIGTNGCGMPNPKHL